MKKIIIIFAILTIALGGLAFLYNTQNKYDDEVLISFQNEVYHLTMGSFDKLEHIDFVTKKNEKMSGVSFRNVLDRFKIDSDFSEVTLSSFDGKSMSYDSDEIFSSVLVKYVENKRTYLKIVFPKDKFEQRWLKYIKTVELK
jgi:hypothetical protein